MKIAIYHDLPSGGAKRILLETTRRLAEAHKINVFTLTTADHSFCDLRSHVQGYRVFTFCPSRLFKSPIGRLNQFQQWRNLNHLQSLSRRIASEIDSNNSDVVYVHPSMWTQAPSVLSYLETPSVYQIQESLRMVYEPRIDRPYHNRGWKEKIGGVDPLIKLYRRKLIDLDRKSTLNASLLLANSRFSAANIETIYGRSA